MCITDNKNLETKF